MKMIHNIAALALVVLGFSATETGGHGQSVDIGKKVDYRDAVATGGICLPKDGKKLDADLQSMRLSAACADTGGTVPAPPKKHDLGSAAGEPQMRKATRKDGSLS